MTEHEQRVAIAEWMGWQPPKEGSILWTLDNRWADADHLPDYTRDLNAMAEAEMRLHSTPEQYNNDVDVHKRWHSYMWFLNKDHGPCATAAQRAEALLRTLGLWKDGAK